MTGYGVTSANGVRRSEVLLRKRAVLLAVDAADKGRGKAGKMQRRLIACLFDHGHYSPGGGWVWGTDAETQRILTSLVNRGLVNVEWVRTPRWRHIAAVTRPRYTLCDYLARIAYPNDSRWATPQSDDGGYVIGVSRQTGTPKEVASQ